MSAELNYPIGVAVDGADNLYVVDNLRSPRSEAGALGSAQVPQAGGKAKASQSVWPKKVVRRQPRLFVHWLADGKVAVRAMGAV
jgi:hypothetical protein